MPTYEYRCTACGSLIEVFQRIGDQPLSVCAVCGGPLRKVFHPAGIVFKGSGFYATDSRASRKGAGDGKGEADRKTAGDQKGGGTEAKKGGSAKGTSEGSSTAGSKEKAS